MAVKDYYKESFNSTLSFNNLSIFKDIFNSYIIIRVYNKGKSTTTNLINDISLNLININNIDININKLKELFIDLTNNLEDLLFKDLLLINNNSNKLL